MRWRHCIACVCVAGGFVIAVLLAGAIPHDETAGHGDDDGAVFYVGGSGPGNYSTIQAAVDDASNGDTVYVFDDSSPYQETIMVNTSICLLGENRTTTVVDGMQQEVVVCILADDVHLEGFTVTNCSLPGYWPYYSDHAGVAVHGDRAVITGNTLTDNPRDGLSVNGSRDTTVTGNVFTDNFFGITLYQATNCTITGNTVENSTRDGVYSEGASGIVLSENTVTGNRWGGVTLSASHSCTVTGNWFDGNNDEIDAWHTNCGLSLQNAAGAAIDGNTFVSDGCYIGPNCDVAMGDNTVNGKPLVYLNGASHMVYGDDDSEQAGQILMYNCDDVTIAGQRINDTTVAIHMQHCDGCHLANNTLAYNAVHGIYLDDADHTHISHTSVMHTRYSNAIYVGHATGTRVTGCNLYNTNPRGFSHGIYLLSCHHTSVVNSSIRLGYIGIGGSGSNTTILNTTIATHNWASIELHLSRDDVIAHNHITDTAYTAIRYRNSGADVLPGHLEVSYNTITDSQYAIGITLYSHTTIQGNTITDNRHGLFLNNAPHTRVVDNTFQRTTFYTARFRCTRGVAFPPCNVWLRNYWERPRLPPKIIRGALIESPPWINIDPLPRMAPYTPPEPWSTAAGTF